MTIINKMLENSLINEKESIVAELKRLHSHMLNTFQKDELILEDCDGDIAGMPVRLNCIDDAYQLLSGDSSSDTSHRGFWGYGILSYDIEDEDIDMTIAGLAEDLISQVLDDEAETLL
ncbi:hypothetical protein QT972_09785 [Microcoleus sp. herbarium7]|uniref:hypothetical protein n=1 Tax=Microcoleus sp. herbarium7 TaxID=3055435 RepID=UPI002FD262C9